jgi:hypothetical protein
MPIDSHYIPVAHPLRVPQCRVGRGSGPPPCASGTLSSRGALQIRRPISARCNRSALAAGIGSRLSIRLAAAAMPGTMSIVIDGGIPT